MNFNIQTHFTEQDAINLFRDSGLIVEQRHHDFDFSDKDGPYSDSLFVWVVQNPYTKEYLLLSETFQKFLDISVKTLILSNVSKLDLYKIFKLCPDLKMK